MPRAEEVAQGIKKSGSGAGKNRGATNNAKRLDAFTARRSSNTADWGGCDPKWLQAVLVGITTLGGAVTLGLSRDGGAYSVTLLLDGDRQTLWFNGDADLDEEMELVVATLESMT